MRIQGFFYQVNEMIQQYVEGPDGNWILEEMEIPEFIDTTGVIREKRKCDIIAADIFRYLDNHDSIDELIYHFDKLSKDDLIHSISKIIYCHIGE